MTQRSSVRSKSRTRGVTDNFRLVFAGTLVRVGLKSCEDGADSGALAQFG